MRRYLLISILALFLLALSSCEKETHFYYYHSGEMVLDSTIVRYLVSEKNCSLTVTAEGSAPTSTIYVKLKSIQSSVLRETLIDSIVTVPHEKSVSVSCDREYSLFLEKDGKTIGIGRFNF